MPANSANNPNGFHAPHRPTANESRSQLAMAFGFLIFCALLEPVKGNEPPNPLSFLKNGTYFILSMPTTSNSKLLWNLYVFVANSFANGDLGPITQLINQYIPTNLIWTSQSNCEGSLQLEANSTAQVVQNLLDELNSLIGNSTEFTSILKACASQAHTNKIASIVIPIVFTTILVGLLVGLWMLKRREQMEQNIIHTQISGMFGVSVEQGSVPQTPTPSERTPLNTTTGRDGYQTLTDDSSKKAAKDDDKSRELQVMSRAPMPPS